MPDREAPLLHIRSLDDERAIDYDAILSFEFTDEERKADKIRLTLSSPDGSFWDDPVFRKGSIFEFSYGYPGLMSPVRRAIVEEVKGSLFRPTVEAHGDAILMAKTKERRTFEDMTRAEVVTRIAELNGFSGDAVFVDSTDQRYEVIAQSGETDAAFLARLARLEGKEFWLDYAGFHWQERPLGKTPLRTLVFGEDILEEPVIENDITAKPGRVAVVSRDPLGKKDVEEVADNNSDRQGLGEIIEIVDPETRETSLRIPKGFLVGQLRTIGGAVLQSTAGALRPLLPPGITPERRVASDEVVRSPAASKAAAGAEAKSKYGDVQLTAVKMRFGVIGEPILAARQVVALAGLPKRLNGRYWIKSATHSLGDGGYTTRLELVSDGHGGHATTGGTVFDFGGRTGQVGGKGRAEVQAALDALVEVAFRGGTTSSAFLTAARAKDRFSVRGYAVSSQVRDAMVALVTGARATIGGEDLAGAAQNVIGLLDKARGDEVASSARLNREDPETELEELEQIEFVDPDGGAAVRYRDPRNTG